MSDNLKLWNAVARPPESALKKITGGRLNGKTDINPQWRIKVMTEQFGPCGEGWGYTIDNLWTEASGDEIAAFARVTVWHGSRDNKVPGIGGSMLRAQESSGLRTNDEAFKMATTDALSVALKALGVAADIYAGLWDGSKYKDGPVQSSPPKVANAELAADYLKASKLDAELAAAKAKTLDYLKAAELDAEFTEIVTEDVGRAATIESVRGHYARIKTKIDQEAMLKNV
jgi:hypothetical protein